MTARASELLARRSSTATLRWALETVPAYEPFRGLLDGSRDPRDILRALPVTDKLDIKRHPDRYLSRAMPASARLEMFTGGSTRNPMRFFLQKHVSRPKEYAFIQDFRARVGMHGRRPRARAARPHRAVGRRSPAAASGCYEPIKRQLILSSDHLERRFMPPYAEALALHRPAFIEAFPSALYPLARWLAAQPAAGVHARA